MNRTRSAVDRMAAQALPTAEQLRRADPAPERELARILAQSRPHIAPGRSVRRRTWRPLLVVATVGVVLGALMVLVPALRGSDPAPAAVAPATPTTVAPPPPSETDPLTYDMTGVEPDPAALLRRLADRAVAQPPAPGTGQVAYVRSRAGQIAGDRPTADLQPPTTTESWAAPDGANRSLLTGGGRQPETIDNRGPRKNFLPPPLPTDPVALEQRVRAVHAAMPPGATLPTSILFADLVSRWHILVVDPAVQAAYLRMLADQPDITVRAGRHGVALKALDNDLVPNGDTTLVLDPDTGALLDSETDLAGTPATPPGQQVYMEILETARVAAIGDHP
jgi:hypothetical protein